MKRTYLKKMVLGFSILFLAIISSWLLTTYVIANVTVSTGSMEGSILAGSRLIGNRLAYQDGVAPKRKDIIIFKAPDDEQLFYVKRIIGIPGDTVEIIQTDSETKTGHVYVNGRPIYEDYLAEAMIVRTDLKFEVPKNCYFCLGDNRNQSYDGRYWENAFVSQDKIVAKVWFQYWRGLKRF